MGRSCLSRLLMLKAFFSALLCSLVLVGQVHAQEVIVGREKKPEAPKQAAPSSLEDLVEPKYLGGIPEGSRATQTWTAEQRERITPALRRPMCGAGSSVPLRSVRRP